MNVIEAHSHGPRLYLLCDLPMDVDMLKRSIEENLKRKKLS